MKLSRLLAGSVAGLAALTVLAGCGQQPEQAQPAGGGSASSSSPAPASSPTTGTPVTPAPAPSRVPPAPPVVTGPSGVVVPSGVTVVPKRQVDASALPDYADRTVYAYDGGRALQIFAVVMNGCAGAQARVVDQSADAVKIVVSTTDVPQDATQGGPPDAGPGKGTVCTQALEPVPVTVRLDAPLGDRMIQLSEGR